MCAIYQAARHRTGFKSEESGSHKAENINDSSCQIYYLVTHLFLTSLIRPIFSPFYSFCPVFMPCTVGLVSVCLLSLNRPIEVLDMCESRNVTLNGKI